MKDEALKLALEGAANYIDALGGDSRKYRQALAAPVQEPVAWAGVDFAIDCSPPAAPVAECVWEHEDSDYMPDTWKSGCGVFWTFTDGSPVENDMKYCCGCGAKLKEKNTP